MKYPFVRILTDFNWPLSMMVQKALLQLFGEHYWLDHALNLFLHFLNSYLVFRLAKSFNWPKPYWLFLLFLFHPANVISVAWMTQIKTLSCFLFAALAVFAWQKGLCKRTWWILAVFLFILSLLSKAASVTVPTLFLAHRYKKMEGRKWLYAIAFVFGILSLWSAREMIKRNASNDAKPAQFVLESSRYYFWQAILPLDTAPIKGRAPKNMAILDYATPAALLGLLAVFRRSNLFFYFAGGAILMLPFLGFVSAPFMKITWVSDQHLYLALPLWLAFWLKLSDGWPRRLSTAVFTTSLMFFIFQTAKTTVNFADEDHFYQRSLRADPGNLSIALNYGNTLAYHDRTEEALRVVNAAHEQIEIEPELKNLAQSHDIEILRTQLIEFRQYKLNQYK